MIMNKAEILQAYLTLGLSQLDLKPVLNNGQVCHV